MALLRPIDQWFAREVLVFRSEHLAYARRLLRNESAAEDLVQEAYARLFKIDNWVRIANPHAFTMRILHNHAMEIFRRADVVAIDHGASIQALEPIDEAPNPDRIATARSELKQIAEILETLPERCREALYARRIEGLSPKEVAEKMDISVSTVEKHLTKGLRLLFIGLATQDRTETAKQTDEWHDRRRRRKT